MERRKKVIRVDDGILDAAESYCSEERREFSGWIEKLMRAELKRRDALPAQDAKQGVDFEGKPVNMCDLATKHDLDQLRTNLEGLKACFKALLDIEGIPNELVDSEGTPPGEVHTDKNSLADRQS
jgi:hypothetical protein